MIAVTRAGASVSALSFLSALFALNVSQAAESTARLALQSVSAAGAANLSSPRAHQVMLPKLAMKFVDARLVDVPGKVQVIARLSTPSVAQSGGVTTKAQIEAQQAAFIRRMQSLAPSARVIAQTQMLVNAVFLEVEAREAPALAKDGEVTRVAAVGDYRRDLTETVPYIGAKIVQQAGITGKGVRVAVLDSGIDYTHKDLGGPGTLEAYEKAWAKIPGPDDDPIPATGNFNKPNKYFPNKKVVGGYDFVGEKWPNGDLLPDSNPISAPDATTFGGHGTHVASIIGGAQGVAPGVELYAVKVCAAPTSSCSGVALIQGLEYAADPGHKGNFSDHVDIVNMSLGSDYGQAFDDDLSAAVDAASKIGILTVASAGNAGDKQFIVGTPAAADSAIAVAQTEVPSSSLYVMRILSGTPRDAGAVFQPWSAPLTKPYQGNVVYPATNSDGCLPFDAGTLAGKIVLVDRGACNFSLKIENIQLGGAALGIIGLIDDSAPFTGAFGGGTIRIPAFMINKADADAVRGGALVRFAPDLTISLVRSVSSTSSRGPRFDDGIIKPDIGAPGASVSSSSGTGVGRTAFGGTSGAAPMVAGSAALLREAYPKVGILDIKQALINSAERHIGAPYQQGAVYPLRLAPITRIGGGEVRVNRAIIAPAIVYDEDHADTRRGGLSFGFVEVPQYFKPIHKRLVIESNSDRAQTYTVKPLFRYSSDAGNGAVKLSVFPAFVTVAPHAKRTVDVLLTIDGAKLRNNSMNAGERGNAIGPLTADEYDGYIVFNGNGGQVALPWQVLPRKAARVLAPDLVKVDANGKAQLPLFNFGVGKAQNDLYNLIAVSPKKAPGGRGENAPHPDARAIGTNTIPVAAGFCGDAKSFVWEFAFSDWRRKATPVAISHEVYLDTNRDGTPDFLLLNADATLNDITDGRQLSWVIDLRPGDNQFSAFAGFYAENSTRTGVTVLRACAEDVGLTFADLENATLVAAQFTVADFYFGGGDDDLPKTYTIAPLGEEYFATKLGDIAAYSAGSLSVQKFDPYPHASRYLGLMLVTNGDRCEGGNCGGATAKTEALLIPAKPLDIDDVDDVED